MKSGSVKSGTLKEALVFRHWLKERNAKLLETLIPILTSVDASKASDLFREYFELLYPGTEKPFEGRDRGDVLSDWLSKDTFKVAEHEGNPNKTLPGGWDELIECKLPDQSVPKEWRKFLKANCKRGRRET